MRIIVCVKQVLDTAAKITIKEGQVDSSGIARILNPYDEYAVEEAIRIKEKRPDTEVTLITLGPEGFKDVLKTGLAMGADHAVHLLDPAFEGLDNFSVARALSQAIQTLSYDLILCGRQAVDDDMAQVGPALAVFLEIPFVSVVTRLDLSEDLKEASVTRQIEGGSEVLDSPLPLLVTCQKGLNEPRLPSLKGIMAAKKKEVRVLNSEAIGFDPEKSGSLTNRVRQIDLIPPSKRKKGTIIEGSAQEAVTFLVRALREEEKLV